MPWLHTLAMDTKLQPSLYIAIMPHINTMFCHDHDHATRFLMTLHHVLRYIVPHTQLERVAFLEARESFRCSRCSRSPALRWQRNSTVSQERHRRQGSESYRLSKNRSPGQSKSPHDKQGSRGFCNSAGKILATCAVCLGHDPPCRRMQSDLNMGQCVSHHCQKSQLVPHYARWTLIGFYSN